MSTTRNTTTLPDLGHAEAKGEIQHQEEQMMEDGKEASQAFDQALKSEEDRLGIFQTCVRYRKVSHAMITTIISVASPDNQKPTCRLYSFVRSCAWLRVAMAIRSLSTVSCPLAQRTLARSDRQATSLPIPASSDKSDTRHLLARTSFDPTIPRSGAPFSRLDS